MKFTFPSVEAYIKLPPVAIDIGHLDTWGNSSDKTYVIDLNLPLPNWKLNVSVYHI